jgi:hypothetical protein
MLLWEQVRVSEKNHIVVVTRFTYEWMNFLLSLKEHFVYPWCRQSTVRP